MAKPITVKSVRRIALDDDVPVYDLTVGRYHNFALSNGVIVHNTATHARDPEFQEILPLSGKIPNVYKSNDDKTLVNERIISILKSIGYNPKNPDDRRIGKIILLADADADGSHIEALLLTLLLRFVPNLFTQGRVYRVEAPLYFYRTDKDLIQGDSLTDLQKKVKGKFDPEKVSRMKGWGEAKHEDLKRIAFDKKTRVLARITLEEAKQRRKQVQRVVQLMGEGAEARRELLGIE